MPRISADETVSEGEVSVADGRTKREVPSFIEARPLTITHPLMRPRPVQRTNLLDRFDEEEDESAGAGADDHDDDYVQVFLRVKPCPTPSPLYSLRDRALAVAEPSAPAPTRRTQLPCPAKLYSFSHIFEGEATQAEVWERAVRGSLTRLPGGRSFTLLTYGASGSGKTYTLLGTQAEPGLVPRSLHHLFGMLAAGVQASPEWRPHEAGAETLDAAQQRLELADARRVRRVAAAARPAYCRASARLSSTAHYTSLDNVTLDHRYYVWVSFVEIYNEGVYDLLVAGERRAGSGAGKLRICEDSQGNTFVKGARQVFVRSAAEAYDVLVTGRLNLQVAATGVHHASSRSHAIFIITLLTETPDGVRMGCARLCDLAGAERAARTGNAGARMVESRAINASLHVLERCVHALRRRERAHVPYRESKLTRLLGAGLSGGAPHSRLALLVTMNPGADCVHETRHVLQLASVARHIYLKSSSVCESLVEGDSTANGTSVASSAALEALEEEALGLRADVERLQWELQRTRDDLADTVEQLAATRDQLTDTLQQLQAARTTQWTQQRADADLMRQLVDTKDKMRNFYEEQLEELRAQHRIEMDEALAALREAHLHPAHQQHRLTHEVLEEESEEEAEWGGEAEAEWGEEALGSVPARHVRRSLALARRLCTPPRQSSAFTDLYDTAPLAEPASPPGDRRSPLCQNSNKCATPTEHKSPQLELTEREPSLTGDAEDCVPAHRLQHDDDSKDVHSERPLYSSDDRDSCEEEPCESHHVEHDATPDTSCQHFQPPCENPLPTCDSNASISPRESRNSHDVHEQAEAPSERPLCSDDQLAAESCVNLPVLEVIKIKQERVTMSSNEPCSKSSGNMLEVKKERVSIAQEATCGTRESADKENQPDNEQSGRRDEVGKKRLRLRRRTRLDAADEAARMSELADQFSDVMRGEAPPAPEPRSPSCSPPEPPRGAGARSCPAKSARSRRKLWTPRAEPLDEPEDAAHSDGSGERVRVRRPSYRPAPRTRARRKL